MDRLVPAPPPSLAHLSTVLATRSTDLWVFLGATGFHSASLLLLSWLEDIRKAGNPDGPSAAHPSILTAAAELALDRFGIGLGTVPVCVASISLLVSLVCNVFHEGIVLQEAGPLEWFKLINLLPLAYIPLDLADALLRGYAVATASDRSRAFADPTVLSPWKPIFVKLCIGLVGSLSVVMLVHASRQSKYLALRGDPSDRQRQPPPGLMRVKDLHPDAAVFRSDASSDTSKRRQRKPAHPST